MKRIFLFLLTNMAIMLVLTVVSSLLGIPSWLNENGINYEALLAFSAVFGFGGSFISLLLSKFMAKRMVGARVIEAASTPVERWLVQTVTHLANQSGIGMPEVAIWDSASPNAFATGARRDKALVAVSTGLLQRMDRDEIEAVLAHEISHIANGDMVTLALLQGVLNTFVIFLARIVGYFVDRAMRGSDERGGVGIGFYVTTIVAQIFFGIIASVIVMWFSRQREFRADAGSARLAGSGKMIAALERLKQASQPEPMPEALAAFGISAGEPTGLRRLFMSHPSLDDRIARLRGQPTA